MKAGAPEPGEQSAPGSGRAGGVGPKEPGDGSKDCRWRRAASNVVIAPDTLMRARKGEERSQ